jgi:hypothetical protein
MTAGQSPCSWVAGRGQTCHGFALASLVFLVAMTGCAPPSGDTTQAPVGGAPVGDAIAPTDAGCEPVVSGDAVFWAEVAQQETALRILMAYLESRPVNYELDWKPRRIPASPPSQTPAREVRDLVMLKVRHRYGGQVVELSPEAVVAIANLPRLERLYLERSSLDDQGLRQIAGLKRLRRLAVWGSNITDTSLPYLAALPELEALDVHDTGVTERAAEWLVRFPKLHTFRPQMITGPRLASGELLRYVAQRPKLFCPDGRLAIEVQGLRPEDLQALDGMEGIEWLYFHAEGVNGAVPCLPEGSLRYVATMPDLKELVFGTVVVPPDDYAFLADPPNAGRTLAPIESLSMSFFDAPGDERMRHIARMPALRWIALSPGSAHGESVGRLGGTQIEEILGCPVTALPYLTGTPSIRSLWFAEPHWRVEFDPEILVHLRGLPNLEKLEINALRAPYLAPRDPKKSAPQEVVDTIMRHVMACPQLRRLSAGFWPVGDDFFVQAAKNLPHLEFLAIGLKEDVTLDGLRNLKHLPLKELHLWRPAPETQAAISALQAEMPDCRIGVSK